MEQSNKRLAAVLLLGGGILLGTCFSGCFDADIPKTLGQPGDASVVETQIILKTPAREIPAKVAAKLWEGDSPETQTEVQCIYNVTDADLEYLKDLPQLQTLKLVSCKLLTDAGLQHLVKLTQLQTLYLEGCKKSRQTR